MNSLRTFQARWLHLSSGDIKGVQCRLLLRYIFPYQVEAVMLGFERLLPLANEILAVQSS